jgi:AraC family transcriptional regulator
MGSSIGHLHTDHTGVVDKRVASDVSLSLKLPKHRHTAGALGLILEGEITETVGNAAFSCTPGAVFLRPPEALHSDRVAEGGASVFVIEPSQAWVEDVRQHGAFLEAPELLSRDRVSALAAQLYSESRRLDAASPLSIQALLFEIGACLIRRSEATSTDAPKWLSRVRSRIDDTYGEKLSLADLAREVGVHSVHLARTFRQSYGVTVGQYLRGRRIEAAARALRNSDASLVDIALDAGFTSQAHFCTTFRRLIGCTPSEHRRAAR